MRIKVLHIVCIISIAAILSSGCKKRGNDVMETLRRAESVLSMNPDSALSIIGSIPMERINSEYVRSHFFLIYEEILYRNGINLIGEEYMEESAAFFDKGKSPREKFLAHFYLAELYYQNGNSYNAMQQYVIAEDIFNKEIKNPGKLQPHDVERENYPARLYEKKGDIFLERINPSSAVKMYLKALDYCTGNGEEKRKGDATGNDSYSQMKIAGKLADAYQSSDKYEEAVKMYEQACNIAIDLNSTEHLLKYLTAIEGIKFAAGSRSETVLEELNTIYAKYNNGKPLDDNYIMLSCLYLDMGDIAKAKHFVEEYKRINPSLTPTEEAGISSLSSSIALARGDYKSALGYEREYNSIMNGIMESEKENSISQVEQAYHAKQLAIENESIRTNNRHLLIIYTLIIIILTGSGCAGIVYWRRKIAAKNTLIREYLEQIENSESSNSMLLSQLDVHKEKEKHLKELLENRFAEIRELAGTYYEFGYSKKLQKKVEQLLSLQSISGDMFNIIEEVVNAKNNGVMRKIREAYPSISEDNLKLLNLIYAGFSPQEISVIINDTPQNIYVRKSRLKRKIMPLVEQDPEMDFK